MTVTRIRLEVPSISRILTAQLVLSPVSFVKIHLFLGGGIILPADIYDKLALITL